MRLRRETGDFNLVFDWTKEQYKCQIRKGLNTEDLVGAIVTHIAKNSDDSPAIAAVAPVICAEKMDNDTTIQCRLFVSDGVLLIATYDPETGVVTFRPDV